MLRVVPTGGRGVNKSHEVDRNGLWPLSEESGLDPAARDRCLPGLSAGLAAMGAVIANRFVRGYSDFFRLREHSMTDIVASEDKNFFRNISLNIQCLYGFLITFDLIIAKW